MAPSRKSWSFTIHLYWDFSKSWSQIQKVGVNYSKFGVNETSAWSILPEVVITGQYSSESSIGIFKWLCVFLWWTDIFGQVY